MFCLAALFDLICLFECLICFVPMLLKMKPEHIPTQGRRTLTFLGAGRGTPLTFFGGDFVAAGLIAEKTKRRLLL